MSHCHDPQKADDPVITDFAAFTGCTAFAGMTGKRFISSAQL
jgi:hypothetical protein